MLERETGDDMNVLKTETFSVNIKIHLEADKNICKDINK